MMKIKPTATTPMSIPPIPRTGPMTTLLPWNGTTTLVRHVAILPLLSPLRLRTSTDDQLAAQENSEGVFATKLGVILLLPKKTCIKVLEEEYDKDTFGHEYCEWFVNMRSMPKNIRPTSRQKYTTTTMTATTIKQKRCSI